jgi:hypothetical protein
MSDARFIHVSAEHSGVVVEHQAADHLSLSYSVRFVSKREPATASIDAYDHYEARVPYRDITFVGKTFEEAIGAMLKGVALLARDGSFNPAQPQRLGAPPIQHAIELLTERLSWQTERRRKKMPTNRGDWPVPSDEQTVASVARDNDIIAALATAIAALARVKDL